MDNKNNFFADIFLKIVRFLQTMNHHWVWMFEAIFALPFLAYKLLLDIRRKKRASIMPRADTTNNQSFLYVAHTNYYLTIALDVKNIIFRFIDIVLNVIALYMIQPLIMFAITLKNLLNACLDMSIGLYLRFFSAENKNRMDLRKDVLNDIDRHHSVDRQKLKVLTGETNQQHFLNISLVNHGHRLAIGLVAFIGGLCMLTGLPEIGLTILTAISIYSFIDYLGWNPLRLLVKLRNQTIDKSFAFITEQEMANQLLADSNNNHNSNKKILSALQGNQKMTGQKRSTDTAPQLPPPFVIRNKHNIKNSDSVFCNRFVSQQPAGTLINIQSKRRIYNK